MSASAYRQMKPARAVFALGGLLGLLGVLGVSGLSGCTSLPTAPASRVALTPQFQSAHSQAQPVDAQWWHRFNDPLLDAWVERAVVNNSDVQMASARLRAAQAGVQANRSRLMPTVALNGSQSVSRSDLPDAVKRAGQPDIDASRLSLGLDWQLDVFGANRAGVAAAAHQADAASAGIAGARLLVVSQVVRQYVLWQSYQARLAVLDQLLSSQQQTQRLVQRREAEGLGSAFELRQIEADLAQTQAQFGPLRSAIQIAEYQLALLAGENPSSTNLALVVKPIDQWPTVVDLPVGQPADLLRRRPDIVAAEQQLAAANASLAQAQAQRYPQFFANAVWGEQRLALNGLQLAASPYSSMALAFSQPLLNRGAIKANITASTAREQEALLNYENTIRTAIMQVESSLSAQQGELTRSQQLQQTIHARQDAVRHANSLYREGQTGLLPVLDLQRGVQAAELSYIDSRSQQLLNLVQVYQALGGGWENTSRSVTPSVESTDPVISANPNPSLNATTTALTSAQGTQP